jgi:hypothetical protein
LIASASSFQLIAGYSVIPDSQIRVEQANSFTPVMY